MAGGSPELAAGDAAGAAKDIPLTALSRRFLAGLSAGGALDLNAPLRPYQQSLWVYRCVSEIQRTCAGIPLRLSAQSEGMTYDSRSYIARITRGRDRRRPLRPVAGRRGVCVGRAAEGEAVESGEAYDLLERPNTYLSWPGLIQSTIGYLLLRGSVAWVLTDMAGSRPGEIHCVDGARVEPVLTRGDNQMLALDGYKYTAPRSGRPIPLSPDEVIYWPLWTDGDNPLDGLAPGVPGRLSIATEYNASLFNAALLNNGAVPGLKVSFPQTLDDDQRYVFRTALRERNAGAANAGKDLILEGGATAEDLGQSMHDLQFDAGKKCTRLEICCLFGVPPVVAGWVDAAGDSSAYTSNALQQYYQQTVMPMLDMFLPGIQSVVARLDSRLVAWWDLEDQPVVQQMRLARVETAKSLHGMGVPLSDINAVLDLGLPDRAWHEIGYLPVGLVPAGDVAAASLLPPQPEGPSGPDRDELDQAVDSGQLTVDSVRKAAADDPAWERAATRLWRAWARSWEPLAKQVNNLLRTRYVAQERRVLKAMRSEVDAGRRATVHYPLSTVHRKTVLGRVLLEVSADREAWRHKCRAFIADANELGLRQALVEAGVAAEALGEAVRRLMVNPAIAEAMQSEAVKISTLIDDASRRVLRRSLAEGLEAGERAVRARPPDHGGIVRLDGDRHHELSRPRRGHLSPRLLRRRAGASPCVPRSGPPAARAARRRPASAPRAPGATGRAGGCRARRRTRGRAGRSAARPRPPSYRRAGTRPCSCGCSRSSAARPWP